MSANLYALYMLVMWYVATSFTFVAIYIYMRLTMCSATLLFPFSPCYCSHLITILRIYKDMQCCYAYLFTIFQHCSHRHDVFSYNDFLLCRALMPVRICCISSAPNCVANFHSNLDDLTIVRASKRISVPSSFLWFWIVVGIFVLFFLIVRVTSCRLLNIPPREVLPTVYFLVGLCALLGDVEVSFSAYML